MAEVNKQLFTSELTKVFSQNKMSSLLSGETAEKFYELTVMMLTENEKYNLTAITEPSKIILNHYADCAVLSSRLKKGATLIDVGCGAGFPTLPLALVRPDLKILAIDSTAKRINYVRECTDLLGLSGVECAVMRAEDRIKESARLGFRTIVVPYRSVTKTTKIPEGVKVIAAKSVFDLLPLLRKKEND